MKKIYVAPQTEQINILTEGVVAASLPMNDTEVNTSTPGAQLSNKRGWSSEAWTADEE